VAGALNALSERRKRKIQYVFVVFAVFLAIMVGVAWYEWENNQTHTNSSCPAVPAPDCPMLGMVGGTASTTACGTTPNALYIESVTMSSPSSMITTNTLGLRVIPDEGGLPVPNVASPASNSSCPTTGGFYVGLNDPAGNAVACWTNGSVSGSIVWVSPTSGACSNQNGEPLQSPITLSSGQTLVVCMYGKNVVPPMAGAYTMQAYGINGASVSGSVDL